MQLIRFESFDVACSGEDGTGVTGGKTWGTGIGFIGRFGGEMSDDGGCVWNDKVWRQRFNVQHQCSTLRLRDWHRIYRIWIRGKKV